MIISKINNRYWSTWTSLFFLIPAIVSLLKGNIALSILVLFVSIFSILHHLKKPHGVDWWWSKKTLIQYLLQATDTILGIIVYVYIVFGIFNLGLNAKSISVLLFILISTIFLFVSNKYYEAYHGIWHILASISILLGILIL